MIQSINPSTEQLIKEYKPYSDKQVLSILEEVANEYTLWRFTSFEERSKILHDIANALNSNIEEHARMISIKPVLPFFVIGKIRKAKSRANPR